jgi:diguanylate cyclase (GGDEF)-like protein/PAS domain S-box-containing protein
MSSINPLNFCSRLRGSWRHSIRRQLILGFGLSSLLLMLGFGFLLLDQQRDFLHNSSNERAISLAHALSISGTSWALANDLVGLQEVVQGYAKTPDLQRAYFLNTRGEVLASTNPDETGFFMTDPQSREMLASTARDDIVLTSQANLIAVAHPVMASGRRLGWVRVEMTREAANANLMALTKVWGEFLVFAVLAVSLVALLLARGLTHGLNHLMRVAAEVERGHEELRADVGREDEIGVLARHLDRMLDALDRQKGLLSESEAKYRFLADNISDVIWVLNIEKNRWEYMSPSVEKMLGYSVDEVVSQPFGQTMTPKSQSDLQNWIAERSKLFLSGEGKGRVYTDEVEQVCRDGSTVWTEVKSHYSRNAAGELVVLGVTRNISERKKAEEQIRYLAFYDPLTRLPNRRLLLDRLGQVRSASKRSGRYAALMFIDLDNFKPLNDRHGHDVGDLLLMDVAHRIGACVREADTVARFGGDEFIVMLGELSSDREASVVQAGVVAEKIRASLSRPYALTLPDESGEGARTVEHRCTASIGVVLFINHEASQDDLVRWADMAMYQAKEAGRNRVHFFEA